MLPWQLPNVRKKYQIFIQLVIASFCLHIIFAGWLFFGYREPGAHVRVTINHLLANDQEIILIPTLNSALLKQTAHRGSVKKVASLVKKVTGVEKTLPKTGLANTITPKKIVPQKMVMIAPALGKKIAEKKIISPVFSKKKMELSKSLPSKEIIQEIKQKPVAPAKKVEKKLIDQKEEMPVIASGQAATATIPSTTGGVPSIPSSDPSVVHATPQEVEAHRQEQLFYHILKKHWKPPVGLDKNCVCQITFTVGWQGSIKNLVVDISSGILMYDIAARSALYSIKMPEWSRGKTLTISFRQ